jgi:hypothetical protein
MCKTWTAALSNCDDTQPRPGLSRAQADPAKRAAPGRACGRDEAPRTERRTIRRLIGAVASVCQRSTRAMHWVRALSFSTARARGTCRSRCPRAPSRRLDEQRHEVIERGGFHRARLALVLGLCRRHSRPSPRAGIARRHPGRRARSVSARKYRALELDAVKPLVGPEAALEHRAASELLQLRVHRAGEPAAVGVYCASRTLQKPRSKRITITGRRSVAGS